MVLDSQPLNCNAENNPLTLLFHVASNYYLPTKLHPPTVSLGRRKLTDTASSPSTTVLANVTGQLRRTDVYVMSCQQPLLMSRCALPSGAVSCWAE